MTDRLASRAQIVEIVDELRRIGIDGTEVSQFCADVVGRPVGTRPVCARPLSYPRTR